MRGEETQLIGCIDENENGERLYIFPGTHSKHVTVKENKAVDVKTYMTGEFFELLTQKSILSNDIKEGEYLSENNIAIFKKGVRDSIHTNLLHNSFLIRANSILGKSSKEENYYYLSGLLIGTELKELVGFKSWISIVGNKLQSELYCRALNELGIKQIQSYDVSGAMVRGHCKVYDLYQFRSQRRFL
jgi:2-dehydro-3-deoxygalactonokinase